MSVVSTPSRAAVSKRPTIAMAGSLAAAAFLFANVVVAIVAPGQLGDHSTGAGRLSEGLVGFSFVAGAAALVPLLPRGILARVFWIAAIAGLMASGLTMVAVLATTLEPPFQLFLAEVAITAPALIGAGIVGIKRRIWPWWVGVGVALLLPIMFLLPFNSLIMGAIWILLAWRARAESPSTPR